MRALGLAALLAATFAATAQAVTIDDIAGDANGIGGVTGLSIATDPVSDATRDITQVRLDRTVGGLELRFTLAEPPDLGTGPITFAAVRAVRGNCEAILMAAWGGTEEGETGPVAMSDLYDCPDEFFGIGAPGFSAAVEGSTVVARFPYTALAANRMGIGPSTALETIKGETRIGTWWEVTSVSGCSPDPCSSPWPEYNDGGLIGPVIDVTEGDANLKASIKTPRKAKRKR